MGAWLPYKWLMSPSTRVRRGTVYGGAWSLELPLALVLSHERKKPCVGSFSARGRLDRGASIIEKSRHVLRVWVSVAIGSLIPPTRFLRSENAYIHC